MDNILRNENLATFDDGEDELNAMKAEIYQEFCRKHKFTSIEELESQKIFSKSSITWRIAKKRHDIHLLQSSNDFEQGKGF